jgi:hypothetical protein
VRRLSALREVSAAAEDDVLACLVVTGEPRPQRVLDDWLDQVVDTLRALGETAADLSPTLDRFAGTNPAAPGAGVSERTVQTGDGGPGTAGVP